MVVGGLQKLTLLDFPEHVACTLFTVGCNFRCPFCHNAPLVLPGGAPRLDEEQFFTFLERRKGILDGVAVTGGEPLIHADIERLLSKIKAMGFAVKLDTNGAFPERLESIIKSRLADYVAMDIKNSPKKYEETSGAKGVLPLVEKSVKLLLNADIPFEFRTTAVSELHNADDFSEIGKWLKGVPRYYIQQFKPSQNVIKSGYTSPTEEELQAYLNSVLAYIPSAKLRGI